MPTAGTLGIPEQYGIQGIPQIANNGGLPTIDYSGFTSFGGRRFMPSIQTTSGLQFFLHAVIDASKRSTAQSSGDPFRAQPSSPPTGS